MFSKKIAPVSELIKGDPDRPLREPVLAIIACLFNLYLIYDLSQGLAQSSSIFPADPLFGFLDLIIAGIVTGLIGWYVAFSILLIIGAVVIYVINRRIGGAFLLVIAIIGFLVAFVGMGFSFIGGFSIISIIINFLSPIFTLLAGIF